LLLLIGGLILRYSFDAMDDVFLLGIRLALFGIFLVGGGIVRLPMKVVTDSDLIPVSDSDVMPVAIGAKRRWHDHSGRTDRHPSTGMQI
jgi:hypothetical protein